MSEKTNVCKFVWASGGVHPDYQKNVEEALSAFVERIRPLSTYCHSGPVEVHIAQNMPPNRPINAVVACSCGFPAMALEGTVDSSDSWKVSRI